MVDTSRVEKVAAHYSVGELEGTILEALAASGKSLDSLSVADLAPVDHFHLGGIEATMDLLGLAEVRPGSEVLDVGGGLGGAGRILATTVDATVTVLDATAEYCRTGDRLTALVGLGDRVTFRQGDGCNMPFDDASFDVVWMQHANMNVADKAGLFREIVRVLRPGGRAALHEVMEGPNQPVHFPVPWAGMESLSFLVSQEEMRALISNCGLKEVVWNDVSDAALRSWMQRLALVAKEGQSPLGTHILMGADAGAKAQNVRRNLEEERVTVVQAVLERP